MNINFDLGSLKESEREREREIGREQQEIEEERIGKQYG